jgi:hypothetical protein
MSLFPRGLEASRKPLASSTQPFMSFHKLVILAVKQLVDRNEYVAFIEREFKVLEFAVPEEGV